MGIEWLDGRPPSLYLTGDREAVLAALVDAAAVSAGRIVPLLPGFTAPGDAMVVSIKGAAAAAKCTAADHTSQVERWYVEELMSRARESFPLLSAAGLAPPADRGGTGRAAAGSVERGALADAVELLMEAVYELNAVIAYSGVSPIAAVDPQTLSCLLALLPEELSGPPGAPAALSMPAHACKQAISILHCLQRLCAAPEAAQGLMSCPGAVARIFAAMACASEGVALEALRLCTRLWAPTAMRTGVAPWRVVRPAAPTASEASTPAAAAAAAEVHALYQAEALAARSAKAACFPPSLAAAHVDILLGPLRQERPASAVVTMAVGEAVAAVVCDPGSRTTEQRLQVRALLQLVHCARHRDTTMCACRA